MPKMSTLPSGLARMIWRKAFWFVATIAASRTSSQDPSFEANSLYWRILSFTSGMYGKSSSASSWPASTMQEYKDQRRKKGTQSSLMFDYCLEKGKATRDWTTYLNHSETSCFSQSSVKCLWNHLSTKSETWHFSRIQTPGAKRITEIYILWKHANTIHYLSKSLAPEFQWISMICTHAPSGTFESSSGSSTFTLISGCEAGGGSTSMLSSCDLLRLVPLFVSGLASGLGGSATAAPLPVGDLSAQGSSLAFASAGCCTSCSVISLLPVGDFFAQGSSLAFASAGCCTSCSVIALLPVGDFFAQGSSLAFASAGGWTSCSAIALLPVGEFFAQSSLASGACPVGEFFAQSSLASGACCFVTAALLAAGDFCSGADASTFGTSCECLISDVVEMAATASSPTGTLLGPPSGLW